MPNTPTAFRSWDRASFWFFLVVVIPTIAVLVYTLVTPGPMYVSQSRFAIEDQKQGGLGGLDGMAASFGLSSGEPKSIYSLMHYIQSTDALKAIEADLGFAQHYQAPAGDPLLRLRDDPNFDELLRYYQRMVKPNISTTENIVTLDVWAFDPATAQKISGEIFRLSEAFVNGLNARVHRDQVSFYVDEQDRAEERVRSARSALTAWRSANELVDPMAEVQLVHQLIARLETELAGVKADIAALEESYARERQEPRIQTLRLRQEEIERQISETRGRLAGVSENTSARKIDEYGKLLAETELAQENLKLAMSSVEAARQTAIKQQRYLITITNPTLPAEPSFPKLRKHVPLVFAISLMLFGILMLFRNVIRDYRAI